MIIYDKVLNPSIYVEIVTGLYYILNADDQYKETKTVLRHNGFNTLNDYAINSLSKVKNPKRKFVLVEFAIYGTNGDMDYICRWCEVPDNVTAEQISEMI